MYDGNELPEEENMFISEQHCFADLLEGLASSCPCGMTRKAWMLESVTQVCINYGCSIKWTCILLHRRAMCFVYSSAADDVTGRREHGQAPGYLGVIIWSTKSRFINVVMAMVVRDCNSLRRMIHGFTCAGMLPTHYIKMSRFAGIGTAKHGYISKGF